MNDQIAKDISFLDLKMSSEEEWRCFVTTRGTGRAINYCIAKLSRRDKIQSQIYYQGILDYVEDYSELAEFLVPFSDIVSECVPIGLSKTLEADTDRAFDLVESIRKFLSNLRTQVLSGAMDPAIASLAFEIVAG